MGTRRWAAALLGGACALAPAAAFAHVSPKHSCSTDLLRVRSSAGIQHQHHSRLLAATVITQDGIEDGGPPVIHTQGAPRLVCVVPAGLASPVVDHVTKENVPWDRVMKQVARRVAWADPRGLQMDVIALPDGGSPLDVAPIEAALHGADVFIATGVTDRSEAGAVAAAVRAAGVATRLVFDSAPELDALTKLGNYRPAAFAGVPRRLSMFRAALRGGSGDDRALYTLVKTFYERCSAEDLAFMALSLVNAYVTEVPAAQGLGKKSGVGMVACILTKCRAQLLACVREPTCKACITCLNKCPPNDQVCSYRCITSYETATFEQFSLCLMTKHNCMGNHAEMPASPDPAPMTHYRGRPLDHETAEDILIGWLGGEDQGLRPWSWKVACGQNPAYDYFPNQHQIFYRGKREGTMWYDPVFQVNTLAGEKVWRRRHYRVRRGTAPGTFFFSVLDNGVTSKEYWRIVAAAEDLSWACVYYSGAAAAAGQAYAGALLITPDGEWPAPAAMEEVTAAFATCGIEMWELYPCHNEPITDAPLDLPPEFATAQRPNRLAAAAGGGQGAATPAAH